MAVLSCTPLLFGPHLVEGIAVFQPIAGLKGQTPLSATVAWGAAVSVTAIGARATPVALGNVLLIMPPPSHLLSHTLPQTIACGTIHKLIMEQKDHFPGPGGKVFPTIDTGKPLQ